MAMSEKKAASLPLPVGHASRDAEANIVYDDNRVAWIEGSGTKVIEIAIDHAALEMDPEQIHAVHPDLSLDQIRAALAYYEKHKDVLDAEIVAREERAEVLRARAPGPFSRADLEGRLRRRAKDAAA
jgi:uncharacterized protein (DUF433 family)